MKSSSKKKVSLVLLLFVLCLCIFISLYFANKKLPSFVPDTQQIEIISDNNEFKVGKEVLNENKPVVFNEESENTPEIYFEESNSPVVDETTQIPENSFFSSLASPLCYPGSSVQEIATHDNMTPDIIIPNGAVGVFSKSDSSGWHCKTGDILSWSFEKFPMENGTSQSIGIGYIKDGVMYETQIYSDSLDGEYSFTVPSDGTYYIYVIGLSSDPISLKGSEIEIQKANLSDYHY